MIEDMDYDGLSGLYRQQAPLRPPGMNPSTSIQTSVSPRFDNIMARSSSIPWSPAPLNGNQYEKTYIDPLSSNHPFAKSSEVWTNNNPMTKSSEVWTNNHPMTKPSDMWANNNAHTVSSDARMNNNTHPKSDIWTSNNAQSKSPDIWSPNNTFTKPAESTIASNNSSNAPMIKSSNKTFGFITDRCTPRFKLGILGFMIGFLAVGIALAVVLVLWLRQ